MTEWLQRSVQFFARRPDVQLVVRIHPGERYLKGPSVAQVVREALPELPAHIHLVEAADPINTYDLVEIADLGLVYTTTVGMEMAMSGVPVIVGGQDPLPRQRLYLDPGPGTSIISMVDQALSEPAGASSEPRPGGTGLELRLPFLLRLSHAFPLAPAELVGRAGEAGRSRGCSLTRARRLRRYLPLAGGDAARLGRVELKGRFETV